MLSPKLDVQAGRNPQSVCYSTPDSSTTFFAALTVPYDPQPVDTEPAPNTQDNKPDESDRQHFCNAMVNDPPSSRVIPDDPCTVEEVEPVIPISDQRRPLYTPHGKWADVGSSPIEDCKILEYLATDSTCSTSIRKGHLINKHITYLSKSWPLMEANRWEGFTSELALYKSSKHMKLLQGLVVPHIINVYTTPFNIGIAMELPHNVFWIEASSDMPTFLKERCITAFEKLHEQGVLHGDVKLRHMLIGADCKVTLINFQRGRSINPIPEVGLQAATSEELRKEMRCVKFKLDYDGARSQEFAKVHRVAELAKRNKRIIRELSRENRTAKSEDLEQPAQEDVVDPSIPAHVLSDRWLVACADPPRRFVVPGCTVQQVNNAIEDFLASVVMMEKNGPHSTISSSVREETVEDDPEHLPLKRKGCFIDSSETSSDSEPGTKRRRLNSPFSYPTRSQGIPQLRSPLIDVQPEANGQSHHRKRKRAHSDDTAGRWIPPMSFSEFRIYAEMERELEQARARKKRKSSLTSITAEYGSDRERSLSPSPTSTSSSDLADSTPRRASPPVSPEEVLERTPATASSSSSDVVPSGTKRAPPIIARDFVNSPYDGPKGRYVPHPPTENRMGLERAKYIRRCNALKCVEMGLRYPIVEGQDGAMVPQISPLPYTFQFEQERETGTKKRKSVRALGALIRKRDKEILSEDERRELAQVRQWEDAQDTPMSKIRFSRIVSSVCQGTPDTPTHPRPMRSILKRLAPIKTVKYQVPWDQPCDEELSPKIGPSREQLDRSGGFGMLGVHFHHDIPIDEETSRREILTRVRLSEECRREVEGIWMAEVQRLEELRQRYKDISAGMMEERELRVELPFNPWEDLEEEIFVDMLLRPTGEEESESGEM